MKIIQGRDIKENIDSIDAALHHLSRTAHKSVFVRTPPIPFSTWVRDAKVDSPILAILSSFAGSFKRVVVLVEDVDVKSATIVMNISRKGERVEKEYALKVGLNNLSITESLRIGDKIIFTLKTIDGNTKGIVKLEVASIWIGYCIDIDNSEMKSITYPIEVPIETPLNGK